MRRRVFISFLALFVFSVLSFAQKKLVFYYIAHDHFERELTLFLQDVRDNNRFNSNKIVIFYLANRETPVYFRLGPDDSSEYDMFIGKLNEQQVHNVYPSDDRAFITSMFSGGWFLPDIGFDSYDSVELNFFINPQFARLGYCNSLISRLYWDMELNTISDKLELNVFHYEHDGYDYSEERVFNDRKSLMPLKAVSIYTF